MIWHEHPRKRLQKTVIVQASHFSYYESAALYITEQLDAVHCYGGDAIGLAWARKPAFAQIVIGHIYDRGG